MEQQPSEILITLFLHVLAHCIYYSYIFIQPSFNLRRVVLILKVKNRPNRYFGGLPRSILVLNTAKKEIIILTVNSESMRGFNS